MFKAAKFEQLVENNPMEFIRKPKHTATAAGIVTPEIYHAIMNEVRGSQIEHLFKFAWSTGLRRGEIIALRWSDFDVDAALVHVTKARKRGREEYEGTPKTAYSTRTVTLSPTTVQNLLAWKRKLAERLFQQGIRLTKKDYIFRSLRDETQPMTLTAVTHIFADLKKRLHLPADLRFHSSGIRTRRSSHSRRSAQRRYRCASGTPQQRSQWIDTFTTPHRCRKVSRKK